MKSRPLSLLKSISAINNSLGVSASHSVLRSCKDTSKKMNSMLYECARVVLFPDIKSIPNKVIFTNQITDVNIAIIACAIKTSQACYLRNLELLGKYFEENEVPTNLTHQFYQAFEEDFNKRQENFHDAVMSIVGSLPSHARLKPNIHPYFSKPHLEPNIEIADNLGSKIGYFWATKFSNEAATILTQQLFFRAPVGNIFEEYNQFCENNQKFNSGSDQVSQELLRLGIAQEKLTSEEENKFAKLVSVAATDCIDKISEIIVKSVCVESEPNKPNNKTNPAGVSSLVNQKPERSQP